MKLAIMQPYFFPYIGYFQLINSVDKYIIYDNLNFIKETWINRNQILVNKSGIMLISVPLKHKSSYTKICDIEIDITKKWGDKLKKSLQLNYNRSPMYKEVYPILEELIGYRTDKISQLNSHILTTLCSYLKINTSIECDSTKYHCIENKLLDKEYISENYKGANQKIARIFEICKYENADTFYNAIGGVKLYPKEIFADNNIHLRFIKTNDFEYKQNQNHFVPNLSIIDVLMFNSIDRIHEMLNNFELV